MTQPAPPPPPAGWYPDPGNPAMQRYWDGQQWTEHVSTPTPPAGWYPDPSGEAGKERYWGGSAWTQERRTVPKEPAAPGSSATASVQLQGYFQGHGRPHQRPAQTAAAQPSTSQHVSSQTPGTTLGEWLGKAWAQAGGAVECPGCHTTAGPPGALCPACGSRFPSPRTAMVGIALALLGGFFLLLALIFTGGLLQETRRGETDVSTVEVFGWLFAVVGVGMLIYSVGRSGPQRQSSCCGCSCAIALLAIPAAGWALWTAGGPLLAAAAVPAWIPLSWALEGGIRLGVRSNSDPPSR